jgi:hypothetical protein
MSAIKTLRVCIITIVSIALFYHLVFDVYSRDIGRFMYEHEADIKGGLDSFFGFIGYVCTTTYYWCNTYLWFIMRPLKSLLAILEKSPLYEVFKIAVVLLVLSIGVFFTQTLPLMILDGFVYLVDAIFMFFWNRTFGLLFASGEPTEKAVQETPLQAPSATVNLQAVETPKQANERAIYAANATIYALNAKKKQY